jgi:hypothetical protein
VQEAISQSKSKCAKRLGGFLGRSYDQSSKGGSDEHVSVDRNISDSGFSLFQRPRRFHAHYVSPLNRVFEALDRGLGIPVR